MASLSDVDGDGVPDMAVGANQDDTGGTTTSDNFGAVDILLLNPNGTVKRSGKIGNGTGGLTPPPFFFGMSVTSLGDLDSDGHPDWAVGSQNLRGSVFMLFSKPINTNPVITSPSLVTAPENSNPIFTVTATDADAPPQTVAFSIVGGVDQTKFSITSGGALTFNTPPDFDVPTDANGDSRYEVTVQASDGNGGFAVQNITVWVTGMNDNAPVFNSSDMVNVAENTTSVLTLSATDADLPPRTVTFSIAGGSDQSKFSVTAGGALSFNSPPDFEVPTDANGDNVYVLIVQASDGSLTNLHALLVTVTNSNEVPVTLPGDYNNNATVDAADYVMWRNALGSSVVLPNDTTPGSVTQADYNIWRANFGQTAPPAGGASVLEVADQADGKNHESFVVPALAGSDQAELQTRGGRPDGFRSTRRDALVTRSLHDHALQAWLTSFSSVRWSDSDVEGYDELQLDRESLEPDEPVDALDLAFAAL